MWLSLKVWPYHVEGTLLASAGMRPLKKTKGDAWISKHKNMKNCELHLLFFLFTGLMVKQKKVTCYMKVTCGQGGRCIQKKGATLTTIRYIRHAKNQTPPFSFITGSPRFFQLSFFWKISTSFPYSFKLKEKFGDHL